MHRTLPGLFILTANWLHACISSPASLTYLETKADLIVVGTASGFYQEGLPSIFSIEVNRVIKGDPSLGGLLLSVSWTSSRCMMPIGIPHQMRVSGAGIWFLQRTDARWALLPVTGGFATIGGAFFPAASGPILGAYAYPPDASATDKLASEISSAVEGASGEHNLTLSMLQFSLDQLNSPIIPALYRRLADSALPQKRILGLSGLIRGGNSAALILAVQSEQEFEPYKIEYGILVESIRNNFRANDAASIAALRNVASDSTNAGAEFREAAGHALAAIRPKDALP